MAQVIDTVEFFIATRDIKNYLKVFLFTEDTMFAARPTKVVKESAHIYFQEENKNRTWVTKNHKGFYKAPENKINELHQVLLRENLQLIPWEEL